MKMQNVDRIWLNSDRCGQFNLVPIACFASAHRTVHQAELARMDVCFRRLVPQLVGAPPDVDWHVVSHRWNEQGHMQCRPALTVENPNVKT